MKLILTFLVFFLMLSSAKGIQTDSTKSKFIFANLHIGAGLNIYQIKYFSRNSINFNDIKKERFFDANAFISFGASFKIKSLKIGVENLNFKLSNFSLGYDVFSFFPKKFSNKKLYFSFIGSVLQGSFRYRTFPDRSTRLFFNNSPQDAFYRSHWNTSLFGLNFSYQYKRFEFYYSILKYRRFVALDAKEHQHLIGIKYNIFKEKL